MKCPNCGAVDQSTVVDSRKTGSGTRRRRKCLICNSKFTTYELLPTEIARKSANLFKPVIYAVVQEIFGQDN